MVVLIVDDERYVAETLAGVFRWGGHQAHWVCGPVEAVLVAEQIDPDLLVADVMMPVSTGIELAIRFRRDFPRCRVLLISGQAETTDLLEEAKQRGYDFEVLAKPIWPPDLLQRAEKLLGIEGKSRVYRFWSQTG